MTTKPRIPGICFFRNRAFVRNPVYSGSAAADSKLLWRWIGRRPGATAPRCWSTPAGSQHSLDGVSTSILKVQPGGPSRLSKNLTNPFHTSHSAQVGLRFPDLDLRFSLGASRRTNQDAVRFAVALRRSSGGDGVAEMVVERDYHFPESCKGKVADGSRARLPFSAKAGPD